jgi:hypothetical protein
MEYTNSKDMGNTSRMKEVEPMPWKGVTVTEQRQRFLEDYHLKSYSITELAERYLGSQRVPSEEREILLPADGQRSFVPLPTGHRRPPCDLAGEDLYLFLLSGAVNIEKCLLASYPI